ncbi:hypothetical protein [uncultured Roseibium sp.]|uniref:hypothetical protein n=1 Tax=uncultured Roseibium sp. TaxID=1936171 RepID=UPI002602A58F|nr:hypothetical protein [uncultured Roseibium sp.]
MFEALILQMRALFTASAQIVLTLNNREEAAKLRNRLEHAKSEKLLININQPEQS